MNFRPWLESTEEQYSNEMTEKLCLWIKTHGRKPRAGIPAILSGSPTAGSRISYNMDLEETRLGEFLKEKISSGQMYPSDRAILQKHGMEGLFDKESLEQIRRETSLKNVEKLAEYYRKNGHYPRSNDPDPEVRSLFGFLQYKRDVIRNGRKGRIYDGERELGISLGLPEDWLDYDERANQAKQNELNIWKLAEFYKKNGRYPGETDGPEARYLFRWLGFRRAIIKKTARGRIYDGERELGISLGLPEDWLDHDLQSKQIEQNELNTRKLAEFYRKNGRYPKKTDADPEARFLASWLRRRRGVIRRVRSRPYYDGERELGISLGLPEDWLDYDERANQAKQNELNLLKLADYYKKNGRYPQGRDPDHEVRLLANWLSSRRRASKGTRGRLHDGERELGISLGLPEDWLEEQKSKSS